MGQPYVGEIRMFGGNFAPNGWLLCEGQHLPISENEVLFQVIGTTYGGDGEQTFALPDLRGRLPLHQGTASSGRTYLIGENGGVEQVTLTVNQVPAHSHPFLASTAIANQSAPTNNVVAQSAAADLYIEDTPDVSLAPAAITAVGGSQPHDNFQPYLCVNFIISLFGIFPSPS